MKTIPEIWLGSEQPYLKLAEDISFFTKNSDKFEGREARLQASLQEGEFESLAEYSADQITSTYGNTGIISIRGGMTESTDLFDVLFGGTVGYDAIVTALSNLSENEDISQIVMAFNSPGGSAAGVDDVANAIMDVDRNKPVYAHGTALSAAYWLATSARSFSAARLDEVGSVGAIAQFTSIAKMLEEQGIETYVSRAGKDKALLSSREPISEEAKRMLDEKTSYLHGAFIQAVMENRPSLSSRPQSRWATGKTFYAPQAIEEGLIDGPTVSLSNFLAKLHTQSIEANSMKRRPIVLSESARAALAAGATLPEPELTDQQADPQLSDEPVKKPAESSAQPSESTPAEPNTELKAEASDEPQAAPEAADSLSAFLKESLKEKESQISLLTKENLKLEDKVEKLSNVESALRPIVVHSCQKLQVALSQPASDFGGFDISMLAKTHKDLLKAFEERYPGLQLTENDVDLTQNVKDPAISRLELIHGGQQ